MNNLLIGCRVVFDFEEESKEGVVFKANQHNEYAWHLWIIDDNGKIRNLISNDRSTNLRIHSDDVRFLKELSSNHDFRRKMIRDEISRLDLMDIEEKENE